MKVHIFILILILQVWTFAYAAVGDLTISPTRVIFEGRERSTQVSLINRGSEAATYRIEFIQYRMTEDGEMLEIDEPNELEKFADELIRFSPRQVELQPNQAQTVRLLLRKPKDLPAGEYRSHMLFYAIPDESAGTDIEKRAATDEEGFSISITPIFRISIPVIVRHGELSAEFDIQDVALNVGEEQPNVSLTMQREGNRSVYGDLNIEYMPDNGDESVLLKYVKDFVLYTSTNTRKTNFDIHVPDGVALDGGKLTVEYTTEEKGVNSKLAF